MRGNVKTKTTHWTQWTSDLSPKHQASEIYLRTWHQMSKWQHWYQWSPISSGLEVAAVELHLYYFIIKGNVWWKHTFLQMVTIVVWHHKHVKLFKPFAPHVTAWFVRKGLSQSGRRTKEQQTRLQCSAWKMPKSVMPSGAMKSARIWQYLLKPRDWIALCSKTFLQQL